MYSQIVIVALSVYPPGVNKLYCIVLYLPSERLVSCPPPSLIHALSLML